MKTTILFSTSDVGDLYLKYANWLTSNKVSVISTAGLTEVIFPISKTNGFKYSLIVTYTEL